MSPWKITSVFASVLACLTAISFLFPKEGMVDNKSFLYPIVNFFFQKDSIAAGEKTVFFPSINDLTEANKTKNVIVKEAKLNEIPDNIRKKGDSVTFDYLQKAFDAGEFRFWLPSSNYFDDFWAIVEKAASSGRVVRILHYGDSQIEMDRISYQLRAYMQENFGGGGPGMIPFRTIIASNSVSQSSSGSLTHLGSFGDSTVVRSRGNYGPMMQCFRMAGSASVSVRAASDSKIASRLKGFSRVRLVYNDRSGNLKATLSDKKSHSSSSQTSNKNGVGSMLWTLDNETSAFTLSTSGSADLYCVTVDNGPGVAVDNIPMRGCSGSQFTLVDKDLLTQSYAQLDVAMIILQFGGNSVPYLKTDKAISNYCNTIGKQIDYVHQCCPKAKILFIGPSDMSTSEKGKLQTYSKLPDLIDSLRVTANNHGAAFWSIYHAMGGWDSMKSWKNKGWAGSDYIHFTTKGAAEMGKRLSMAFQESYRIFIIKKRWKASKNGKS